MEGMNENLNKLSALIKKLESGELEVQELLLLEDAARSIFERSVILKYKAYEKSVKTNAPDPIESFEEPILSAKEVEQPAPIEMEEEPSFDFGIFDQEIPEEVVADLPEVKEHTSISRSIDEEKHVEAVTVKQTTEVNSPTFLDQLHIEDNSIASRFAGSRIETLIGAFGLNERLRFINELFDGSSELFSEAIKSLDSQHSLEEALKCAEDYAHEHNWNPKDDTVVEFMVYLSRRYA